MYKSALEIQVFLAKARVRKRTQISHPRPRKEIRNPMYRMDVLSVEEILPWVANETPVKTMGGMEVGVEGGEERRMIWMIMMIRVRH